jgi:hypothetical protein
MIDFEDYNLSLSPTCDEFKIEFLMWDILFFDIIHRIFFECGKTEKPMYNFLIYQIGLV